MRYAARYRESRIIILWQVGLSQCILLTSFAATAASAAGCLLRPDRSCSNTIETLWRVRGRALGLRRYSMPHSCNKRFMSFITCVSYVEARLNYRLDVSPSVCPSVRLSVTRWYCIKTAENIVMLSSPHDSPFILVLCVSRYSRNSNGVTPCGAAK